MNLKSFRFRIALWYSLTLFIAAAIIFTGFYLVTRQILFQQVDRELSLHVGKLVEIASRQGINMHEAMLKQQLYAEFSDIPGMVVVLLDSNGSLVRSSLLSGNPYETFNFLYQESRNSGGPVYLTQSVNNTPLRFTGMPINTADTFLGVVLVAHPVEAIQNSLNILLKTLAIIFTLLIFPSLLAGRMLAAKVMRPIAAISDKMAEISSEHLEARVDNPGSGDEIEKLGISFNQLLDRLQQSFGRERQFIADVAHELKTPVSTLKSGIELALSKPRTTKEYKNVLSETMIDVNRLTQTIKNVLDLAWLGSDNANLQAKRFNLSNTLMELKEIGQKLASQKNIRFKAEITPRVFIAGSEDKIARAILNLIDNAVKFTPSGKSIWLSLKKNPGRVVLIVKDTGVGIPQKELPHIFTRFYRGAAMSKTFGSGLGLAIAQGIIKAHHGEISVTSQVGQGTTVTISLSS